MKRITTTFIITVITVLCFTNCQNKKTEDEKTGTRQEKDSISTQVNDQLSDVNNVKPDATLSFNSYVFAENLKNDNFFESENTGKLIELKNVGIINYLISGDEVTLTGLYYDKEKNLGIPVFTNNPPGRAFVTKYYDKLEIKYEEKYKHTYSASLRIVLKDPKAVKKLKMYVANEAFRNYEYSVDKGGIEPEYRDGFIDLIHVSGIFKGKSEASNYTKTVYEIVDAEIN